MSAATLSFLPNFLVLVFPASTIKSGNPENAIHSPFLHYRYLRAKAFLTNVGSVFSYYLVLVVYVLMCAVFKARYKFFFERLKQLPNILIQSVIIHFTQILLASFLHLKYVLICANS
eukprot:TRINITY_DN10451_c0_g1_i1.p3 TRINITY_DN10451_c0_g1~~TRINITY_DN10451_c0_g1_i1.p3  ORF type:complete len:117 (-),score=6.26 TRINITY_DN10451_c0_g1_i1:724-1074(-)